MSSCLNPSTQTLPDVDRLVEAAKARATSGVIDSLNGLAGDKVFIMHGTLDKTVAAALSTDSADFYRKLGGAIVTQDDGREMAHTFPTDANGTACTTSEVPYIGSCGFDGAGEILAALYADKPSAATTADGELRRFDQKAYLPDGKDAMLADKGFVYIPKACAAGETCGLHIALHGCLQNADAVGEAFVRDAGYNRWADAMHLVVLYPQTRASYAPLNPKACWDWWGYSGADYDTRQGVQMRWFANRGSRPGRATGIEVKGICDESVFAFVHQDSRQKSLSAHGATAPSGSPGMIGPRRSLPGPTERKVAVAPQPPARASRPGCATGAEGGFRREPRGANRFGRLARLAS